MNQIDQGGRRIRKPLQRGIIILPSAFTLGNLFFGLYAMVTAARGDFIWAAWYIVFASVLDLIDGRVARFTRTGTSFGAELDSLVDAISFGVAPGFIVFQLYFADSTWGWLLSFVYVTAIVVRLARFNVEQGGGAKAHFHGLPSPTAWIILATSYPFSQTPIFEAYLGDLPWPQVMGMVTIIVSVLLVSHVPYALVPRMGVKTPRGWFNMAWMMGLLFLAITIPRYYFFTASILYTSWGLLKSVLLGLLDRLPDRDPLLDEDEEDQSGVEIRDMDYREVAPSRFKKRRRRKKRRYPPSQSGEGGEGQEQP